MPIEVRGLSHSYKQGTPFEKQVLFDINLKISDGEFVGMIGPTRSGKTTLAQHFNGLFIPKQGQVLIDGQDLANKKVDLIAIRHTVGYVFQNPEHQLFKATVGEDIAFGPLNQKCSREEVQQRVRETMKQVGLDYETFYHRDIFALSGGQKRRAAIAGVLACQPKVLVLDDITAGLDPKGREDILGVIQKLHTNNNITIIFISNSMDDVAQMAERIVVMNQGRLIIDGKARQVFEQAERLKEIGLDLPQSIEILYQLKAKGWPLSLDRVTSDEALEAIIAAIKEKPEVEYTWS